MLDPTSPIGSAESPLKLMKTEPHPWQFSGVLVPPIEYGVPE